MECVSPLDAITRGLQVMAADPRSPLSGAEREAVLCWLEGLPCEAMILLPHDVLPALVMYLAAKLPNMLQDIALEAGTTPLPKGIFLDSPLEIPFFLTWEEQGLDLVYPLDLQYPINRGKYRIDFAHPPLWVGIELDGYTYHSDREQFTKDRQRQREIEMLGWHIIRFSGDELRADCLRCVNEAAHFLSIQQFRKKD